MQNEMHHQSLSSCKIVLVEAERKYENSVVIVSFGLSVSMYFFLDI